MSDHRLSAISISVRTAENKQQKIDNFSLFPLHEIDNPETENLDPSRRDRVHIPPGPPPEQLPAERLKNFEMVFTGYDEKQAVVEATRCIHCPATEPCI